MIKSHVWSGPKHAATRQVRWSRQLAAFAAGLALVVASVAFATPANAAPSSVTVVRGNTLSGLAQRWCGSASKWPSLFAANPQVKDANKIYVGQRLTINCNLAARTTGNTASRSTTRSTPATSGWVNPLPGVNLTSCWGAGRGHKGLDMDGYMGQPVRVASAGVVSRTGQIGSGYGNEIIVAHVGSVWSHYAHLSRIYVSPGQRVSAGQTIGAVGNSGQVVRGPNGDGSHLHFEIALKAPVFGSQVNPAPFLRARGVSVGC